jgi:hypothetical protein
MDGIFIFIVVLVLKDKILGLTLRPLTLYSVLSICVCLPVPVVNQKYPFSERKKFDQFGSHIFYGDLLLLIVIPSDESPK